MCLKEKMSLSTMYGSLQLTIVTCVAMLVIFLRRVNTMIDIVTAKMFDAYSHFHPRNRQDEELVLTRPLHLEYEQKRRKRQEAEMMKQLRFDSLTACKKTMTATLKKTRPFMGSQCSNCCNSNNQVPNNISIVNLFNPKTRLIDNGFLQSFCSDISQVYSVKKYDYPRVEGTVLKDDRLKAAIEKTTIEQFRDLKIDNEEIYAKLLKKNETRAQKLLRDMRSTLSDFLLRFTSWVLYKLLPLFLNSVAVHPAQIEMLNKASKRGLPMIFIPLHRSHLDYIMVSFILLNRGIRSPLVAAGDNLRIPFFGSLLRGLGAFYIKRRIDPIRGRKDHVYKAVLHTYMNECLRAGHNIEFFLEGGRTRTGKPCMPKYGIFSVIIDAFMDGTIEDALLVPISMNYEKLIDGNFVREQLGQPKEMETFGLALSSIWKILNSNYGMVRIDFNEPFSLRELVQAFTTNKLVQQPSPTVTQEVREKRLKSRPSTTSLYGTDVVDDEHKQLVQCISKHVLYDCAKSTAIMSTNAVAFLLLNKFRDGVNLNVLVEALDDLRKDIHQSYTDLGFSGESEDVVRYAIDLLGPGLVQITNDYTVEFVKPITILPNVIELAYYSNCCIQIYVKKAIVATALSVIEHDANNYIDMDQLFNICFELFDILKYEFLLYKPCQIKENVIIDVIDDFVYREEIFIQRNNNLENDYTNPCMIDHIRENLGVDVELENTCQYELNKSEETTAHLKYYKDMLKSWLEPYCYSALTLEKLVGETMLEKELTDEVLDEMKHQFTVGNVTYGESVGVDPIKNSLKLFQDWDILECHTEENMRLLYLKDQHNNSDSVKQLYDRLNKYRLPN